MLGHFTESGIGEPVVLLHGMPFDSTMWSPQVAALADSYRVVTPDLRGLGRTPLDEAEPDLRLVAGDVVELLDHLKLGQVVLGGLSMGGYVAMEFMRAYPGRVRGLIFADTRATVDTESERAGRLAAATTIESDNSTEVLQGAFASKLVGARTPPHVAARLRRFIADAPPAGVAWLQRAMAARGDYTASLASLRIPTLVLVGESDVITGPPHARLLATTMPNAELVVIPEAGHVANLEAPNAFNQAVLNFLGTL